MVGRESKRFAITFVMNTTSKGSANSPGLETVAEMIERLGEPPEDVWNRLVAEASNTLGQEDDPNADENALRSPGHAYWQTHGVDHQGRLVLVSEELMSEELGETEPESDDVVADNMVLTQFDEGVRSKRTREKKSRSPKVIALSGGLIAAGLLSLWLFWPSRGAAVAERSSVANSAPVTDRGGSPSQPATAAGGRSFGNEDELELSNLIEADASIDQGFDDSIADSLAMSPTDVLGEVTTPASTGSTDDDSMAGLAFSLDALIPAAMQEDVGAEATSDETAGTTDSADTRSRDGEPVASFGGGEEADVMSDAESDVLDSDAVFESTSRSISDDAQAMFVALPPLRDGVDGEGSLLAVPANVLSDATLEFPTKESPYRVVGPSDGDWSIENAATGQAVAEMKAESDGLRFAWLETSASRDLNSLSHACFSSGSGKQVYLRPSLEADAMPIDLASRDVTTKWDLTAPPEPKQTRLTLGLNVPEGVDVGWIEPIENESPRKVRGIAVLSQRDSESVAVVIRVDIQTTKMMTARVRFGARLDPSMPWQWTDRKDVATTLAVVTQQMELADQRFAELEVAISQAGRSRARRLESRLEQQQEQLERQQKNLQLFSERLAELDQLIATLAGQAYLEADLTVSWPDRDQPVLRLVSGVE